MLRKLFWIVKAMKQRICLEKRYKHQSVKKCHR